MLNDLLILEVLGKMRSKFENHHSHFRYRLATTQSLILTQLSLHAFKISKPAFTIATRNDRFIAETALIFSAFLAILKQ